MVSCSKHYRNKTIIYSLFEMKIGLKITLQILTVLMVCVKGERPITLTTAISRDDNIYVKPTAVYRRIPVDRNVGDRPSTSYRIFHRMGHVRRSRADIWSWDYWCQLQPKTGDCTDKLEKYYYDTHLDKCVTFLYSGCKGNKNKFDTLVECERHCKGAAFMPLKNIDRAASCSLQPNAGLCMAIYDKFYYDVNKKSCVGFIFSGCGGNDNRFPSIARCLSKCVVGNQSMIEDK